MIDQILTRVIGALERSGVTSTLDARNISAPGCFVTVTKFDDFTLSGSARATGEILAICRDHGGQADITAMSELLTAVTSALDGTDIAIDSIETNQQATPPSGGVLPASKILFSCYT